MCASGQAVPEPMEAPWGFLFIPPESKGGELSVDVSVVPRMLAD